MRISIFDRTPEQNYELALITKLLDGNDTGVINTSRTELWFKSTDGNQFDSSAYDTACRTVYRMTVSARVSLSHLPSNCYEPLRPAVVGGCSLCRGQICYTGGMKAAPNTLTRSDKIYAWFLGLGGLLGLIASFVITYDELQIARNPNYHPSCSLNPVISCGSVMRTPQAHAIFGMLNSWWGLIGFSAVIVAGVSLLAAGKLANWYWRLFNLGTLFGVVFIHWLFFETVYRIHALCPWCMVVWSVTIPIFWYTTLRNFQIGVWPTPKALRGFIGFLQTYKNLILILWYLTIILLILHHFWYYFRTVL